MKLHVFKAILINQDYSGIKCWLVYNPRDGKAYPFFSHQNALYAATHWDAQGGVVFPVYPGTVWVRPGVTAGRA